MIINNILISQAQPTNLAQYTALENKYGLSIDFKPFFLIEPLTSREFRAQRVDILDHTAIVFSARHTIDAFFHICELLRIKVPETMKYFCTTEAVAMYLQKHIVFRKKKIFFGTGTPDSIVAQIGTKHKGEKFLITTSEGSNSTDITSVFDKAGLSYRTAVMVKAVSQDLKSVDLSSYDMVVVYNPSDVRSLQENFPNFKPGNIKFVTFGKQIVKAMEEASFPIEIKAPTPEAPSVVRAIELYLEAHMD